MVCRHTDAARFAPALSPPIAMADGSTPSDSALRAANRNAVSASSAAAGKWCSGASRYPTDSTRTWALRAR
jgi:hypothetical protein